MNKLRFPAISNGYLGMEARQASLNGQFYAGIAGAQATLLAKTELIFWPQRVPARGFFDELLECETTHFRENFEQRRRRIYDQLNSFVTASPVGPDRISSLCNVLDLAARFGLLSALPHISSQIRFALGTPTDLVRLKLQTYCNSLRHSRGEPVDVAGLIDLIGTCADELIRALSIARLIVILARYARDQWPAEARAWHQEAGQFVQGFAARGTLDWVWKSMILRALPMMRGVDQDQAHVWMLESVEAVEQIPCGSALDRLAQKELLCTTLQSVAKMRLAANNESAAIAALERILALDPFDPVGYTEIAMVHWRAERAAEALPFFKRAVELGPPAFAMNAHFEGLCRKAGGDWQGAKDRFELSAQADPTGLSPRLELWMNSKARGELAEATRIKNEILNAADLREQLTETELSELNNA